MSSLPSAPVLALDAAVRLARMFPEASPYLVVGAALAEARSKIAFEKAEEALENLRESTR